MQLSTNFTNFIICISIIHILQAPPEKNIPSTTAYKGILTSLKNREYQMTDISIAGKKNSINVYTAPCDTDAYITQLSYNPKNHINFFKLADVKEIEIPYPYAAWTYKYPNRHRKDRYLLIKVIWNSPERPPTYYLIEPKRRLTGNIQKKDRFATSKIPFSGFKKIMLNAMPR